MARDQLHDEIASAVKRLEMIEDDLHQKEGMDEMREAVTKTRANLAGAALDDLMDG